MNSRIPLSRIIQLIALPALSLALLGCPDSSTSPPAQDPSPTAPAPAQPLVNKKEAADWCGEHGVPESVCSRCNAQVAAEMKEKGDWCNEHAVAESQCFACNPKLEQEFLKKKPGGATSHSEGDGHGH